MHSESQQQLHLVHCKRWIFIIFSTRVNKHRVTSTHFHLSLKFWFGFRDVFGAFYRDSYVYMRSFVCICVADKTRTLFKLSLNRFTKSKTYFPIISIFRTFNRMHLFVFFFLSIYVDGTIVWKYFDFIWNKTRFHSFQRIKTTKWSSFRCHPLTKDANTFIIIDKFWMEIVQLIRKLNFRTNLH